jgi:monofunctional biosynthetic peptidoglycan transglycosylase
MPLGTPLARACVIGVPGDDKRYNLNLRTDDAFDGVSYRAVLDLPAGAWTLLRTPLSNFAPSFRGRRVVDAAPPEPAKLCGRSD